MINTFDMIVYYIDGEFKEHYNISRVAAERYKQWYEETLYVDRIVILPSY